MEAGDVVVRVRSKMNEGEGAWRRKENGILGRVTLSVAEVGSCLVEKRKDLAEVLYVRHCLGLKDV